MDGRTIAYNLRNNVKYDENGITKAAKAFIDLLADSLEELETAIEEKQKHLENLQKVNEDLEERVAIMSEGGYVPDWHFFKFRPATDEEKEYYKEYGKYNEGDSEELQMLENVPGDGEEVFLWNGYGFTVDTYDDGIFDGVGEIEEGMAWMYLPEPPKEGEQK